MVRRIGKIGRINIKARKKIAEIARDKDIRYCENCGGTFGLAPAHRHNRVWYRNRFELLWDYQQWVGLCQRCHGEIEGNREKTAAMFKKLRDELLSD